VPEADRPTVARLYDFLLGGHHNFAADRELARRLLRAEPNASHIAAENRAFGGRAVRYLIDAGIRQFIDLGSGIPARDVHEIAHRGYPQARVVYVDNDEEVVGHGRHLLGGNPLASVIEADLRDSAAVLAHPQVRRLIDLNEPVGLLMVAVLHFVADDDDPLGIVGHYASSLAPGSCLAISHATLESAPATAARAADLYNKNAATRVHPRKRDQVLSFFGGFDLVEPGLVSLPQWRHEGQVPPHPEHAWFYAGVGRRTG
jgi:trans-aconitate methyltransferase